MDFPKKVFNGVFELPLLRNAQKRHKNTHTHTKHNQKKEGAVVPHLVFICQIYAAFKKAVLRAPWGSSKTRAKKYHQKNLTPVRFWPLTRHGVHRFLPAPWFYVK
jgi:hypothetical protein